MNVKGRMIYLSERIVMRSDIPANKPPKLINSGERGLCRNSLVPAQPFYLNRYRQIRNGSIVFYHTDHVEVEFAGHFCSLFYNSCLCIVDVDDGISVGFSVHTEIGFLVEDDRTLWRNGRHCKRVLFLHSLNVSFRL